MLYLMTQKPHLQKSVARAGKTTTFSKKKYILVDLFKDHLRSWRVMAPICFSGISGIVLEVRRCLLEAFLISLLHSWNHLSCIGAADKWILAGKLRIAAKTWVPNDVDVGSKGCQANWVLVIWMKSGSTDVWQCPLFCSHDVAFRVAKQKQTRAVSLWNWLMNTWSCAILMLTPFGFMIYSSGIGI